MKPRRPSQPHWNKSSSSTAPRPEHFANVALPVEKENVDTRAINAELSKYGRCRCMLLLPCSNCLPECAADIAETRPGAGRMYPEGA